MAAGISEDYQRFDALALAQLVRSRQVSAEELLEAAIEEIERSNPFLNAVIGKLYDHGRAALRAGLPDGPLRGVPFLLKDLHALCSGTVSTQGSAFFAGNLADHDSELVARYKRAGLVILGKTNTPEFGLTVTTEPRLFGATRNPWNRDYMAGGSSGGSAAAVAAGMVPVAHASDGGGSIRIPASCCGVFGLKPTRGRNPHGPDRGEGWAGMSTEHVVSRSVRDTAALLDATCGPDQGAPYFALPPARPFLEEVEVDPAPLRIGLALQTPTGEAVAAQCAQAAREAARLLEALGHRVEEASLQVLPSDFGGAFRTIIAGNIRAGIEQYAAKIKREPTASDFERVTWLLHEMGAKSSAADYARAVIALHRTGREVARLFGRFDVLLTPTLPKPPQLLGTFDMNTVDIETYGREVALFTSFTSLFNASGNPAMSLPLHWSEAGLPIGVQCAGRYGDEGTLFRLAGQLERARPWFGHRPTLADV